MFFSKKHEPKEQHQNGEVVRPQSAQEALDALRQKKKKKNKIIAFSLLGVFILFILIGVGSMVFGKLEKRTSSIPLATVEQRDFKDLIKQSGTAQAQTSVIVSPEIDGIIENVQVQEGDTVKEGDLLFEIKNDVLVSAVDSARAHEKLAKKQLAQAKDAYGRAQEHYEEALKLYNSQPSRQAQQQLPHPDTVYESVVAAENAIDQAKAALEQAHDATKQAQEKLNKREVRAPQAGSIIAMNAKNGAAIGAKQAMANPQDANNGLIQIADMSKMGVKVSVSEIDVLKVHPDQKVEIHFAALPDLTLPGHVEKIASTTSSSPVSASEGMDPRQASGAGAGAVASFNTSIVIDQNDERIRQGMSCDCDILLKEIKNALVVPSSAIFEEDGENYIWTTTSAQVSASTVTKTKIKVIYKTSFETCIEGVSAGTQCLMNADQEAELNS